MRPMSEEEWAGFRHFLGWLLHKENESRIEAVAEKFNSILEKYAPPFSTMLGALFLLVMRGTATQMLNLDDHQFEQFLRTFPAKARPSVEALRKYVKEIAKVGKDDERRRGGTNSY